MGYDGYGRLYQRTTPEQGTAIYAYNPDDTLTSMTDARGAAATYGYNNNRGLVTSINYNQASRVAATPSVSFGYDAVGNRTSMSDGLGSMSYAYNSLSQMTSETRTFSGVGSYQLSYSYNLAGELTGISNPWGASVGYNYDSTGRLNSVSGAGYAGVSSYASNISYRAFGAVKSMSFGDHQSLSTSYDTRMRPTSWNVSNTLGYNYSYFEHTERVSYAQNIYDSTLDRSYNYDQVGALQFARSGAEARATFGINGQQWGQMDGPYSHQYDYDQFGNMTYRHGWGGEVQGGTAGQDSDIYYTYTNGKNQRDGFTYDAAGNLTPDLA
jgi:YD repeat-containing protein